MNKNEIKQIEKFIRSNASLDVIINEIEKSSLERSEIILLIHPKMKSDTELNEYKAAFLRRFLNAIRNGNIATVKRLNGIRPFGINEQLRPSLTTAMHTAAYYGHAEIVRLLMTDAEFVPGMQDSTGDTPADLAHVGGAPQELVDLLTDLECRSFLHELEAAEKQTNTPQPKPTI
ncbi:MAG: ankyrin repeat domain-containing protein [Rhodomicrobiaceae bacterium]